MEPDSCRDIRGQIGGERDPIVVGYDGSAAARSALRWAADAAARHRVPLRLVYATHRALRPVSRERFAATIAEPWEGDLSPPAVLARGVDGAAARVASRVPVSGVMLIGTAAAVLCGQSTRARMVVLGTDGTAGLVPGSTSCAVAGHATCPVVALRDHDPVNRPTGPVVVTIDDPADAQHALGFAFSEAAACGASITAVGIHTRPTEVMAALSSWEREYPDVPVAIDLVAGNTAPELVRWSRAARLLVVTPHGHAGGVDRVGRYLLRHATCPLVITRARTRLDSYGPVREGHDARRGSRREYPTSVVMGGAAARRGDDHGDAFCR